MWDRIVPTCFLDSDSGFQDVLFVLCLHANQYTYTEKNCGCLPQPELISKHHVMHPFNFSSSTSVKWQLFDLSIVNDVWSYVLDILEKESLCIFLGRKYSAYANCCWLLFNSISFVFYLQLHKNCLKLIY